MKVYSRVLTQADLYRELRLSNPEADVIVDEDGIREFTPRRGGRGFQLYLEGLGARHRRARNQRYGRAATWDDYGLWFARLFKLDPKAEISFYKNVQDFLESTGKYQPDGAQAPWLADSELVAVGKRILIDALYGEPVPA